MKPDRKALIQQYNSSLLATIAGRNSELICLDLGRRTTQLMRDWLGGTRAPLHSQGDG